MEVKHAPLAIPAKVRTFRKQYIGHQRFSDTDLDTDFKTPILYVLRVQYSLCKLWPKTAINLQ
jgi:hypothetical protein